ncbi:alpha/beta superfamily hydrolase [Enterococcus sp. 10A9_DIV0425]|uniref:Alpha/beta superfamily hydrolase n=1 Tax=Candidatus Enterococcus wittei TaxID=1987383 RepID=A0A242JXC6_9ENTE|nr:alpha/beta hydrolase [Enterococcus sp. 10A9_DIV0425]OTP09974.1 alpha/beta superfamily hydrolase [Enterococcus sp. 10A9_DIV0425]THE12581.1 alpha/beta hydrolase [Enterococcus hirae]
MVVFYILLLCILLFICYQFLAYFYAKKLIEAGLQRGTKWYEKKGHQLMDPASLTTVEEQRQKLEEQSEDFWHQGKPTTIKSHDGLKLSGRMFISVESGKKWVICVHDYRSTGKKDMSYIGKQYAAQGFNVLIPDLRAHGESEGEIIGMGWLDRLDLILWINEIVKKEPEASILLHGGSMGASTIMMASGEKLPKAVKGLILDSGFVSVYSEFRYMLSKLTIFPKKIVMRYANRYAQKYAGYSLKQASATRQLGSNHLPVLIIHGEKDHFVPLEAAYTIQNATAGDKALLLVPEAEHLEAVSKDPKTYWTVIFSFIEQRVNI